MDRVNLYNAPHKTLRKLMCDFCISCGRINSGNSDEINRLKVLGNVLFAFLDEHAFTEDSYILEWLQRVNKTAALEDKEQHYDLSIVQQRIYNLFNEISAESSQEDLNKLYLDFTFFMSQYFEHIFHEESVTQVLLWNNYNDEELGKLRIEFLSSMNANLKRLWYEHMIPSQNLKENRYLISVLKATLAKEDYDYLRNKLLPELSAINSEYSTMF